MVNLSFKVNEVIWLSEKAYESKVINVEGVVTVVNLLREKALPPIYVKPSFNLNVAILF